MKLGYHFGYWAAGPPPLAREMFLEADRLGYDSIWTAEAYGSDCLTPLAWWGSQTERITLGTDLVQMSARTPTATAMAAMTLDHLSGGRVIIGLGASGPQVVEGWYGQSYPRPLARTREYVEIMRLAMARERPVAYDGEFFQLPLGAESGFGRATGLGKPLRSTLHPLRPEIPIYLGAEGPRNVALSAEIADGWLPLFLSPKSDGFYREALAEGFARPGARRGPDDFEVAASVPVVLDDDVERAADQVRPLLALYIGGMGAKGKNFHLDVFARLGYEAACDRIQEHFLAGRRNEAVAAVPTALVQDVSLVGPIEKIRDELPAWERTVLTTLLVQGTRGDDRPMLRALAELLL